MLSDLWPVRLTSFKASRGKWTIDFGLMSLEEAALYEIPFEYLKKHVYPIRSQNRRHAPMLRNGGDMLKHGQGCAGR